MPNNLQGKTIAILATDGFERVELTKPKKALEEAGAGAGARAQVVSPTDKKIKGWDKKNWGEEVQVDVPLESANPAQYGAPLLPGGIMNPDHLRMNPDAVKFVKQFFGQAKPVAAICHGPWMLVEAGAAKGRTITSRPSLKTDIQNADGTWVDKEVVVSYGVVTSRNPDDIPAAFNREMIELLSKGANASGKTDRQAA
jgi:protease I